MTEINVSGGIECGGFHWPIDGSQEAGRECAKNSRFGESQSDDHLIRIDTQWSPERQSETIIHEILEAVKHIYLDNKLPHRDLTLIANGLHQVMRSLGVQFVVSRRALKDVPEGLEGAIVKATRGNGHG